MQWGTETNIELAKRSIELMKHFAREMGINIWLRQGGYLFLATSDRLAQRLEQVSLLHNRHGVPTVLMTPDAARDLVPQVTMKNVKLCAFNKEDGVIFPWPFLWGYAQSCQRRGIRVETFTQVTGFEISQSRIRKVRTDRGDIACDTAVLAAGAWSPAIAKLAGVVLPGLIIVGLMAIPYIDTNPKGNGYYGFRERKWEISIFLYGFLVLWSFLIITGTFLRGPNWNFFGPYEYWDPNKLVPLVNVDLSELVWVSWLGQPLPKPIRRGSAWSSST